MANKSAAIIASVVALCLLGLLLANEVAGSKYHRRKTKLTPVSKNIQVLASEMKRQMNQRVDPCKDFHQYVCGGRAVKARREDPDKTNIDRENLHQWPHEPNIAKWPFTMVDMPYEANKLAAEQAANMLLTGAKRSSNVVSVDISKLAEIYNASCMKVETHLTTGNLTTRLIPSFKLKSELLGKEPEKRPNWLDMHAKLVNTKIDFWDGSAIRCIFLDLGTKPGTADDPSPIVAIRHLFHDHELPQDMLEHLEPNKATRKRLSTLAKRLAELNERCIEHHGGKFTDNEGDIMTVDELSELAAPGINWHRLIADFFGLKQLHPEQRVELMQAKCVAEMAKLLSRYQDDDVGYSDQDDNKGSSPERATTLTDWILNKAAINRVVPAQYRINCDSETKMVFAPAFVSDLLRKLGGEEERKKIHKLSVAIVRAYERLIKLSRWPSWQMKAAAIEKLRAIRINIGWNDGMVDKQRVAQLYSRFELDPNNFITNQLSVNKIFNTYLDRRDQQDFSMDLYDRTALYGTVANSVNLLTNYIGQSYNSTLPSYVNFGYLGTVVAHEISHAFDRFSIDKNATGQTVNDTIFGRDGAKLHIQHTECLIDLYDNMPLRGSLRRSRGRQTINENIADSGFVAAYYAYLDQDPDFIDSEPLLPGFKGATRRKLFWIRAGQIWCFDQGPLNDIIIESTHSPNELRANIAIMKLPEFRADFGCPIREKTNQECRLW